MHNAPRLSVTGPGVQADRARWGGWGRERSVTDKPGLALPDFDLTRPGTPRFRPTGPGVGGGGGRGLLQTDSTRFFARCFTGLSLPRPPKTSVTDTESYWINIYQLHRERVVTGRIFQALPTQTDTIVALILLLMAVTGRIFQALPTQTDTTVALILLLMAVPFSICSCIITKSNCLLKLLVTILFSISPHFNSILNNLLH